VTIVSQGRGWIEVSGYRPLVQVESGGWRRSELREDGEDAWGKFQSGSGREFEKR
jgi:hypothetical protein